MIGGGGTRSHGVGGWRQGGTLSRLVSGQFLLLRRRRLNLLQHFLTINREQVRNDAVRGTLSQRPLGAYYLPPDVVVGVLVGSGQQLRDDNLY